MDSMINWLGGKSKSSQKIVDIMPEHRCYCEIFLGGGWVYFRKKPSEVEVINDINDELINFYRVIQKNPNEFKERSKEDLYSRSIYYNYLNDYNSGIHKQLTNIERAWRFFTLIKAAFGSKFAAGWGYGQSRNQADAFFNELNIIDEVSNRLKRTQIDCRDFSDVIEGYDHPNTLYFLDPPYMKSDNNNMYFKMIDKKFEMFDYQRLYEHLISLKGKFILTIDNTPWIRDRFCTKETKGKFFWMENDVYYCSADKDNRRTETELIITNYDFTKVKKHTDSSQMTL